MNKTIAIVAAAFLAAALPALCFAADGIQTKKPADMGSDEYLKLVRHPHGRESWSKFQGSLIHRRKGADDVEAKIQMGMLFTPSRTVAQIVVDGQESYNVGQSYEAGPDSTSVETLKGPKNGEKPLLAKIGLRPQDLTMDFLFWNARPELPRDSVKGQDCRVFIFDSPDKTESAKASISADACFPLRAEWTKNGEKKPYRSLEVDSIKREGDFFVPGSLLLYGPGWKTKIEFEDISVGLSKNGIPNDLFPASK